MSVISELNHIIPNITQECAEKVQEIDLCIENLTSTSSFYDKFVEEIV